MITVVIAHRNRWEHLRLCLDALAKASNRDIEISMVDQSDPYGDSIIVDKERFANVSIVRQSFVPPFHKSAAVNLAALNTRGEYLTLLDVDCLVPVNFFARINEIHQQNPDAKIGHTVRLLSKQATRAFKRGEPVDPKKFNAHANDYNGHAVGSGIFTIRKEQFLSLGGLNTAYRGWGLEDLDFNLRAEKSGIKTILPDNIDLMHLWHERTPDWHSPETEKANRRLFLNTWEDFNPRKSNKTPCPIHTK